MPETISAEMSANIWKILVAPGDAVEEETPLLIMESMKMEIPVLADAAGTVVALRVAEGDMVNAGQPLIDIATD